MLSSQISAFFFREEPPFQTPFVLAPTRSFNFSLLFLFLQRHPPVVLSTFAPELSPNSSPENTLHIVGKEKKGARKASARKRDQVLTGSDVVKLHHSTPFPASLPASQSPKSRAGNPKKRSWVNEYDRKLDPRGIKRGGEENEPRGNERIEREQTKREPERGRERTNEREGDGKEKRSRKMANARAQRPLFDEAFPHPESTSFSRSPNSPSSPLPSSAPQNGFGRSPRPLRLRVGQPRGTVSLSLDVHSPPRQRLPALAVPLVSYIFPPSVRFAFRAAVARKTGRVGRRKKRRRRRKKRRRSSSGPAPPLSAAPENASAV